MPGPYSYTVAIVYTILVHTPTQDLLSTQYWPTLLHKTYCLHMPGPYSYTKPTVYTNVAHTPTQRLRVFVYRNSSLLSSSDLTELLLTFNLHHITLGIGTKLKRLLHVKCHFYA